MLFPDLNSTPHEPQYARVGDETAVDDLLRAVNTVADRFAVPDKVPLKAAAVVYLGLCRLRWFSENNRREAGSRQCYEILGLLKENDGKNESVNCSYFKGKRRNGTNIDHGHAVKRACKVYIPRIRSRKQHCLLLLALGSKHSDEVEVPKDDTWLADYKFQ